MTVEEIRSSIGADSLSYVSLDGLVEATGRPKDNLCRACFDGEYPTVLPDPAFVGKNMLEITPVDALMSTVPSVGGHTALEQP